MMDKETLLIEETVKTIKVEGKNIYVREIKHGSTLLKRQILTKSPYVRWDYYG